MMKGKIKISGYWIATVIYGLLAVLAVLVFVDSIGKNLIRICVTYKWEWWHDGSYVGLFAGFAAYLLILPFMQIPRMKHNMNWFMKFTHELTHTLVAVCFFAKIREFVVKDRECYVSYKAGPVGYVPITLAPYCIPIYTFMLFPFRFAGDSQYMIVFDFLIALSYAFHVHSFIRQTRRSQPDIKGCGLARSATFIILVHLCVLSLISAIPGGGVMNAFYRVFWGYPIEILTSPCSWFHEIIRYF